MKDIFKYCLNRLKTLPELEYISSDKGQLSRNTTRPPVGFPTALIKVEYPQTANNSKVKQTCSVRITVKLGFDYDGDADNITPEEDLEESLKYFDICQSVHETLQGSIDQAVFSKPLERISQLEETRTDGMKVLNIVYSTVVHEI